MIVYGFARTEAFAKRSDLVKRALYLAREIHADEWREVPGDAPFVNHPLTVAELLEAKDQSETMVAAGLLHDALEYTDLELAYIRERFGVDVAAIVFALTEDLDIEDPEERRQDLRERVSDAGPEAQRVFAADKVANVMALRGAYADDGEIVSSCLPVGLDLQIVTWEKDMEMLFEAEEGVPLFDLLSEELIGLWCQRIDAGATGWL